jgi:negative regulator of sigma E activity
MENLWALANFMGWVDSPNLNAKELVRAILTKEVDIDKLVDVPKQQFNQPFTWQWTWIPMGNSTTSSLTSLAQWV